VESLDALISLGFLINTDSFKNQVHRKGAENAEGNFFSDPIGRPRLDQRLHPFGIKIGSLMAPALVMGLFFNNITIFVWRYLPAK